MATLCSMTLDERDERTGRCTRALRGRAPGGAYLPEIPPNGNAHCTIWQLDCQISGHEFSRNPSDCAIGRRCLPRVAIFCAKACKTEPPGFRASLAVREENQ